jgi:arsenate reductase
MKVYAYSGCDSCRKAIQYLEKAGKKFELLAIRETPPSVPELKTMLKLYDGKIAKLFNTSGKDYREMELGKKLEKMSEKAALSLLAKNGNLVKRPFVLVGNTGMVGFRTEEWKKKGFR